MSPPFSLAAFFGRGGAVGLLAGALAVVAAAAEPIDRQALVARHSPAIDAVDFDAPLTVGNGRFAFTGDITGLQSFPDEYYRRGIPVETLARWAWHSEPNPHGYRLEDTFASYAQANGESVQLPTRTDSAAATWLRRNPHLLALAQIGLEWDKPDGTTFTSADVRQPAQRLDLWTGTLHSRFELDGAPVEVTTCCHPDEDLIAVTVRSRWLATQRLRVRLAFPRGHDLSIKNTPPLDWSEPTSYETRLPPHASAQSTEFAFRRDDARYVATLRWENDAALRESAPHHYRLTAAGDTLTFVVRFSAAASSARLPTAAQTRTAAARHWGTFWQRAAALDLSGSAHPLASKLERRVVLSQYLTAIQCVGDVPPQESGLTCSTWFGKHHTEMIWWHAAHFALWNYPEALEQNLRWYEEQRPAARQLAHSRGLRGARWAKMVGRDGRESPGGNPLIVWNQPHVIYLCELLYRRTPTPETANRYGALVLDTAEAMAAMLQFDRARNRYILGPPLWIAQEIHDPARSQNPSFELAYWRWGLDVAQRWRERLGLRRDPTWDEKIARLAALPQQQGKYVALESMPDTWSNPASRHDHPEMLMPLGFLPPTSAVDGAVMSRTLDAVLAEWDWETKIWGWDYPMIAMTATRLGRPSDAVEILLRDGPNNRYAPNGHCPQRSDTAASPANGKTAGRREIAAYLPANGAFLAAVALMVAGWDGCEQTHPGFPTDGTWRVRAEGWQRLP